MIDTWAQIGSCAQIGSNVHISGGVGIGGASSPDAPPVIIEDDFFVGARSQLSDGVRVGRGSVISMGVVIGATTPIIDRNTGSVFAGTVPPYSVVCPAFTSNVDAAPVRQCAVIVKTVDAQTRSKTSINELVRD